MQSFQNVKSLSLDMLDQRIVHADEACRAIMAEQGMSEDTFKSYIQCCVENIGSLLTGALF